MNSQMETRQLEIRRQRKRQRHRRKRIKMVLLSLPVATLLFAGWMWLSGDEAVGSNAAQRGYHSSYQSADDTPSQSGLTEKTASGQSEPKSNGDDWRLLLINPWNSLPDGYKVTLTQLKNGQAVDERCYPDLQKMMDDCRADGLQPLICSSYRTQEKQQRLFDNKVNSLVSQGYSADEARTKAAKSVAVPGTSEHQTGLAVDIVDVNNQNLNESQEDTAAQKWMIKNSWRYGFILRYPPDKSDITGIIYEPWHYRYVGKEAAKEIHEQGICLEEYLSN